ncbi:MAG: hypothetical protein J6X70_07180, partial [Muribaculaceae bacterium]|nr:hypothetical protein [Muribaculaceae bacterium]
NSPSDCGPLKFLKSIRPRFFCSTKLLTNSQLSKYFAHFGRKSRKKRALLAPFSQKSLIFVAQKSKKKKL